MAEYTGPIQVKRATTAEWESSTIPLREGEWGLDLTLKRAKLGDGVTLFAALPWAVTPGEKGDKGEDGEQGPPGLPGPGAVANDDATEALIQTPGTKTSTALSAAIAGITTPLVEAATVTKQTRSMPALVHPEGMARWRALAGAAAFQQLAIVAKGDSITAGGNANNAPITNDAQVNTARARGWVRQLARLFAVWLGIDPGEGYSWFTPDDRRWSYATNSNPAQSNYGPVGYGRRLVPGNTVTALAQDFAELDVLFGRGGLAAHAPRVRVDDVEVTPTLLPADAKAAVVGAGKWVARGAGTAVAQAGDRRLTVTRTGTTGTVVADYGTLIALNGAPGVLLTTAAISAATARAYTLRITFYDAGGAIVGSEISAWTGRNSGVGTEARSTFYQLAPAGATQFRFTVSVSSTMSIDEAIEFKDFDAIPAKNPLTVAGGTSAHYSYHVTVAAGTHKLEIVPAATDNTDVSGVVMRKRLDAGVVVDQIGLSGSNTSDHTSEGNRLIAATEQFTSLGTVGAFLVALGTNDFQGQAGSGITPAVYKANLKIMTDRHAAAGSCTLLIAGFRYSNDAGKTNPESAYYAAARQLATEETHVAFIDLNEVLGGNAGATALGYLHSETGIHPWLAGHGEYARIIFDGLMRQAVTLAA